MADIRAIMQTQAFARLDGVYLAVYWAVSFLCTVYLPQVGIGGLMALLTPFFVGWRLIKFRNYARDGRISLGHCVLYCIYTFFCGAFIFSAFQFFYLSLADDGRFATMITTAAATLDRMSVQNTHEFAKAMAFYTEMSPLALASLFMLDEIILGIIVTPIISLFCFKRPRRNTNTHSS